MTSAIATARGLFSEHGLNSWRLNFMAAVGVLGYTDHRAQRIVLSLPLWKKLSEADRREVLLHEICHALVGPSLGHGATWAAQAKALEVPALACKTFTHL